MSIEKALQIHGWMSESELAWLAEQAAQRKRIVEIGCWQGRSTRALAENTPGMVLAVDIWADDQWKDAWAAKEFNCEPEKALEAFKRNLGDLPNVIILQMHSLQAAELLRHNRFDMIFIDGGHEYQEVVADINAWRPLLKHDGLLCGDDYGSLDVWAGVTMAVNENVANVKRAGDKIWYE